MSYLIGAIVGIFGGGAISYFLIQTLYKNKVKEANDKADNTV